MLWCFNLQTPTLTIVNDGTGGSQIGTKEDAVCSNRGICNEYTGVCECFLQYGSSDGWNGFGSRGDCGHVTPFADVPVINTRDVSTWRRENPGAAEQYLRKATNAWERKNYVSVTRIELDCIGSD